MIIGAVVQQPDDRLDYDIEYDEWFAGNQDAIQTITVDVIGTGNMIATGVISSTDVVKVWIQGGATGEEYTVEVTATTVSGRIKQTELIVRIEEF